MNTTQRRRAEALLENMPNPPEIALAAYIPRDDVIVMPYFTDKNDVAYYAVLFHECIHISGHPSRLGDSPSAVMGNCSEMSRKNL